MEKGMNIRWVVTATAAAALMATTAPALIAQNQPNRREEERRRQAEQREAQAVVKIVDAVAAGKEPAPADIPVSWVEHYFVKGIEGTSYIPYTLSIDRSTMARPNAALYVRAVDRNAPPPPPPAPPSPDEQPDPRRRPPAPEYPWEDIQIGEVGADGSLSRAMQLKPGEYDLFIVVKEIAGEGRNQPPPKMGLLRRTISVRDLWAPELIISTPIFASSVEPLATPLSTEDQRANPFTFGGSLKVVPAPGARFKSGGEMQMLFWIYGTQHNNGVPDLTIDYNFHTKTADGEKFFNKTQPQAVNASTLPPGFSMTAGHQVLGFLGIPLKSFPAGDYRVEFKITDTLSGKTLTENATFTVES